MHGRHKYEQDSRQYNLCGLPLVIKGRASCADSCHVTSKFELVFVCAHMRGFVCVPAGARASPVCAALFGSIWLWVKIRYPKWNPGKWKHGPKPAVFWWFHFGPYPFDRPLGGKVPLHPEGRAGLGLDACRILWLMRVRVNGGVRSNLGIYALFRVDLNRDRVQGGSQSMPSKELLGTLACIPTRKNHLRLNGAVPMWRCPSFIKRNETRGNPENCSDIFDEWPGFSCQRLTSPVAFPKRSWMSPIILFVGFVKTAGLHEKLA